MKKIILTMFISVFLITGCSSAAQNQATETLTPTSTVTCTPNPTTTPTPDYTHTKELAQAAFSRVFNVSTNNLKFTSIEWKDDKLTFKGDLANFVIEPSEPKEHSYLHFSTLLSLAELLDITSYKRYFTPMNENTVITIISRGKFSQGELLTETSYTTFQKIVSEEITTEVEWLRECEIFSN